MSAQAESAAAKQKRRESGVPASDADSIKVICRFRPARAPRKDQVATKGAKLNLHSDSFNLDEKTGEVEFSSDYQESKRFKFDKVRPLIQILILSFALLAKCIVFADFWW